MTNRDRVMAYVDGELDDAQRAEFERALAADPELARRVQEQKALRDRVRAAYAPVLDEPMPERLLAAARGEPAPAAQKVVDLASVRAARRGPSAEPPPARPWRWPAWGAMAASLAVGVVVGVLGTQMLPGSASSEPFATMHDGALVARGPLEYALTHQLASSPPPLAPVQIGTSFVATSSHICRSFVLDRTAPLAGLACHEGGLWRVRLVTPTAKPPESGGYRSAAATLPPVLLKAIDDTIQGPPLDAAAEKAAQQRGWK